jgi:hypothetical protein
LVTWSDFIKDYTPDKFFFHQLTWLLVLAMTILNEWLDAGVLRSVLIICLLIAFGATLLRLQPFRKEMYWKLPIRAALVLCTILSQLLDVSTLTLQACEAGDAHCMKSGNVAQVLVWMFTLCCLSLLIVLPVSFFYFNYGQLSRRHAQKPIGETAEGQLAKLIDHATDSDADIISRIRRSTVDALGTIGRALRTSSVTQRQCDSIPEEASFEEKRQARLRQEQSEVAQGRAIA